MDDGSTVRLDRTAASAAEEGTRRNSENARQLRPADVRRRIHQLRNTRMRGRPHRQRRPEAARKTGPESRGDQRPGRAREAGVHHVDDRRDRNGGTRSPHEPGPVPNEVANQLEGSDLETERGTAPGTPRREVRAHGERRGQSDRRNPRRTDPGSARQPLEASTEGARRATEAGTNPMASSGKPKSADMARADGRRDRRPGPGTPLRKIRADARRRSESDQRDPGRPDPRSPRQ